MIIFGTRGLTLSGGKGQFSCPRCGDGQDYIHRKVRRFFTLYFIPLIPLNLLGEYVECQTCESSWDVKILDPNAEQEEFASAFEKATLQIMLLMMLADGAIDDKEIAEVAEVYAELTEQNIQTDEVRRQADELQASGVTVATAMKEIAPMLNESGKETVIKAALFIAMADGEFKEEEQDILLQTADAMSMTEAHFNGVLQEVVSGYEES